MTSPFGEVRIDEQSARITLHGIGKDASDLSRPMAVISRKMTNSVRENFVVGGRVGAPGSVIGGPNRWEKAKTPPAHKRNNKRYGIKAGDEKGSTLRRSGRLMRSIMPESTSNEAYAATNLVYAAIHNFGGTTKAHTITARHAKRLAFAAGGEMVFRRTVQHPGSKIPARPYAVIQPGELDDYQEVLLNHCLRRGRG